VAGVRFLHGVQRQHPHGSDAKLIDFHPLLPPWSLFTNNTHQNATTTGSQSLPAICPRYFISYQTVPTWHSYRTEQQK
jgi:hypothetical protein